MSIRELSFSSKYLRAVLVTEENNYIITGRNIIVNLSEKKLTIDHRWITQYESTIIEDSTLCIDHAIIFHISCDLDYGVFPHRKELIDAWNHVYEIFAIDSLKDTNLWRSRKDNTESIELNLWFADSNTDCGIHNQHAFKELHTQIFGIGRMQKFRDKKHDSLYQEILMSPGFTHQAFYDDNNNYPWHQYKSDTDCIWLAIEVHHEF